jgi:hypothetical protein
MLSDKSDGCRGMTVIGAGINLRAIPSWAGRWGGTVVHGRGDAQAATERDTGWQVR